MADVFISYHEKSAGELVAQIANTLETAGISCWYAKRDIPTGGDFACYIPPQIDACEVFLLILTKNVYKSKHIENELGLAFGRLNHGEEITILPLEIGNFERKSWVRYYLIHTQSMKISSLDEVHIHELATKVAHLLSKVAPSYTESPAKIIKTGSCGDNVAYTFDENGMLTISGKGTMWNYEWDRKTGTANTPWWDVHKTITRVLIQSGVTSIAKYAFCDCMSLTSVSIPDSITEIGIGAFDDCINLTGVMIPDGVTAIEVGTFSGCVSLTSVNIPDSATKIEFGAFKGCKSLTSIKIPDSVTKIELGAFSGCTNLTIASVPAKAKINGLFTFPQNTAVIRRS